MALLKRKVQVTFEMDLEITEIPPGEVNASDEQGNPSPEFSAQLTDYQNEMLRAIVADPAVLRTFLRSWVAQEAEATRLEAIAEFVPEVDLAEADIVRPLVGSLSAKTSAFFSDVIERGHWWDATDGMHDHFKVTLTGCTITGI